MGTLSQSQYLLNRLKYTNAEVTIFLIVMFLLFLELIRMHIKWYDFIKADEKTKNCGSPKKKKRNSNEAQVTPSQGDLS